MVKLMPILLAAAILAGATLEPIDASHCWAPTPVASLVLSARIDWMPDTAPPTPGPADPNGPRA